jgi:hypothetical protein
MFLQFLLDDGRIRIQIRVWILTNNDGAGSGRSKNIRIRIYNTGSKDAGLNPGDVATLALALSSQTLEALG